MRPRFVVCTCTREQAGLSEPQLRVAGWRLVQVPKEGLVAGAPCDVFVWLCPPCSEARNALLRARSAS